MATNLPRVTFNGQLVAEDMAAKAWEIKDLAREANISLRTAYRFISGELQTITTGRQIARALGKPISRYLIRAAAQGAVA
jgi:predicted transcriptional regulator